MGVHVARLDGHSEPTVAVAVIGSQREVARLSPLYTSVTVKNQTFFIHLSSSWSSSPFEELCSAHSAHHDPVK